MASHLPSSAVPIAGAGHTHTTAPHGASATAAAASPSARNSSNANDGSSPTRLSRGNSFRIPLPPSSPSVGVAASPSSPGTYQQHPSQLGTSYGSSTGSRLGNFALGFRRNRGASTNRGDLTSPVAAPPSPPASAFPALQASTSLSDFGAAPVGSPYFDGAGGDTLPSHQVQATSPSGHNPSASISSSTTRGYFTRRGFGRKNTGGLLSGGSGGGGGRTPTSEQPPSLTAMQRSRSSSQPSLPLSLANPQQQQQVANANPSSAAPSQQQATQQPASANAATMAFSGISQSVPASNSQTPNALSSIVNPSNGGSSSTESSRRPSGEATRVPASATLPNASSASPAYGATNSAPATATTATAPTNPAPPPAITTSSSSSETQHIRLVPHLESTRSLHFDPISRDILPTIPLRIGRFTDRNPNQPISALDQNRVAFKSKVVSRTHAEIWFEATQTSTTNSTATSNSNGWFIRDLKSSSGTFLNHIRLSGAGMESRPFPIRDGDVLQLGVDYQGGTEEIYRCVKMRIELNRGWQRGANSFNTNALRQIRALGNVSDQTGPTSGETSQKKKKKHRKHKKKKSAKPHDDGTANHDGITDIPEGDEGSPAGEEMQVVKKEKEKKSQTPPSGVTDCCICLFSVTVYQALFIAPCSHIFHFKCIRPLLMQHHPGFSCPLCRTFGDLEADVEQDDVPEPVQEECSSSSSSGESESEEENIAEGAPALPDKVAPDPASVNASNIGIASTSESTAVLRPNVTSLASSDPNLDTLRPGRKSPLVASVSEFGASGSSQAPELSRTSISTRPSLDIARLPSGTRTPPSRGSRVASFQSAPLNGAAVAAALEGHTTPHTHQHHHHQRHSHNSHQQGSSGEDSFNPPSAGDFDPDIRRGSIYVHGADGHAMHIPITGRSRPGSVYEGDISSDTHHHHDHHHHHAQGNTQSPSASAAEKNKARSVRSMRMTKSKNSTNSLKTAAAAAPMPSAGTSSAPAPGHRRRGSGLSTDEEDTNMDEEPLTARPMPGAVSAPGSYPFPDAHVEDTSSEQLNEDSSTGKDGEGEEQDDTPPSSHQEDSGSASDVADSKGKGKETRSRPSSTTRDIGLQQGRQLSSEDVKQSKDEVAVASVHAIV